MSYKLIIDNKIISYANSRQLLKNSQYNNSKFLNSNNQDKIMQSASQSKRTLKQNAKQNLSRLSNSKCNVNTSICNNSKINCNVYYHSLTNGQVEDKIDVKLGAIKCKKTVRAKSSRKNILSCEQILMGKYREPYRLSEKQSHRPNQRQNLIKTKFKKKKNPQNWNFHKLNASISKSNSLIVFSEKDSTLNSTLMQKTKNIFFQRKLMTETQAAIKIQKIWRGYLTRKLLEQYINDQQPRLLRALSQYQTLTSSERKCPQGSEMNQIDESEFSHLSSIGSPQKNVNKTIRGHTDRGQVQQVLTSSKQIKYKQNNAVNSQQKMFFDENLTIRDETFKRQSPVFDRSQLQNVDLSANPDDQSDENDMQSEQKEEILQIENIPPIISNRLVSNRKSETNQSQYITQQSRIRPFQADTRIKDLKSSRMETSSRSALPNKKLELSSSVFSYSCLFKTPTKPNILFDEHILSQQIDSLKQMLNSEMKQAKKRIKFQLSSKDIAFQDMIDRCDKVKNISDQGFTFLDNVFEQLMAIVQEMRTYYVCNAEKISQQIKSIQCNPKSEYFTVQLPMDSLEYQDPNQMPLQFNTNRFESNSGRIKLRQYLNELLTEHNQNYFHLSQLQFLCQVLKSYSEKGVKDIAQRCFMQFTVQIITQNISIYEISQTLEDLQFGKQDYSSIEQMLIKWINQLNKWEMGVIQEVTQTMESSSFLILEGQKTQI